MRCAAALLAAATVGVFTGPARAQEETALTRLAASLATALVEAGAELPPGALVVRARGAGLGAAPDREGLALALLTPALAALRADARFSSVRLVGFEGEDDEAAARATRLGASGLVDLTLSVEAGRLSVVGLAWDTHAQIERAQIEERVPLDAALRRYVGWPPLATESSIRARSVRLPTREVLALVVADLDGDGQGEIVLVEPEGARVVRLDLARGRAATVARVAWPNAPRAPSPRRRALATAVTREREALVRLSEVAQPFVLRRRAGVLEAALLSEGCAGFPIEAGCAELVDGRDFFDETILRAEGTASAEHAAPAHFYAHTLATLADREGARAEFEALVTPHGRLAVRVRALSAEGAVTSEPRNNGAVGYGTALAMTDLDLDGSAEILGSLAVEEGAPDHLVVVRVLPRGTVRAIFRSEPLEGPVWVAAAGDVDGDGLPELLAVEAPRGEDPAGRARLWVVR